MIARLRAAMGNEMSEGLSNCLEIAANLATLLSVIVAVIIFFWRSSQIKIENWQDLVVQDFTKISIELKEISALDVVMGNPGLGQINVNEALLRVWRVVQRHKAIHYRALAFGGRTAFVDTLENTARRMDEAYKLMAARDATGFNQIKFLSENAQLDLLAELNGGGKATKRLRKEYLDRETSRIKDSYKGYI